MTDERAIVVAGAGELAERAAAYVEANLSPATRRAYAQDWASFERWCVERDCKPEDADDAGVAVYLAWLADEGRAPASIERAWIGIFAHLCALNPDTQKGKLCRQVLRGIRRTSLHRNGAKRPLLAADLAELLAVLGDGSGLAMRNRALLLVGFAGGFRRSELAALDVGDLAFSAKGLRVRLRRSKTNQEGALEEKGLFRGKGALCPVAALARWLSHLNAQLLQTPEQTASELPPETWTLDQGQPVFPACDRWGHIFPRRITPVCVLHVLRNAARRAGLDASAYGAHSLRAGFVTEAALRRKPLDAIMRQTGHRSLDQVLAYIRHAHVFAENASEGLLD
jgi:integrase